MAVGLMVMHNFPCVRVGKTIHALKDHGWQHDLVCQKYPPQLVDEARAIYPNPYADYGWYVERIRKHPASIIHVHNEPNWPVIAAKEAACGRPVIMNVHDPTRARPNPIDPHEDESYEAADAFVFVSEEQRAFTIASGISSIEGKPYCIVPNYALTESYIDKTPLTHIGGVCYAGGCDPRGVEGAWRDLSCVADVLDGQLHVYPGNSGIDYGIVHETVFDYGVLPYRLAQHDWGFSGAPGRLPAWEVSVPNKLGDYLAAGIPLIAWDNPLLAPFCDEGLGIYVSDLKDIARAAKENPKPYKKRVMKQRHRFTFQKAADPLARLYEELGGA